MGNGDFGIGLSSEVNFDELQKLLSDLYYFFLDVLADDAMAHGETGRIVIEIEDGNKRRDKITTRKYKKDRIEPVKQKHKKGAQLK